MFKNILLSLIGFVIVSALFPSKVNAVEIPTYSYDDKAIVVKWEKAGNNLEYSLFLFDADCTYCILPESVEYSESNSIKLTNIPKYIKNLSIHIEGFKEGLDEAILYVPITVENPSYDASVAKPENQEEHNEFSDTPVAAPVENQEDTSSQGLIYALILIAIILTLILVAAFILKRKNVTLRLEV